MDIITQRFIAIGNRILTELRHLSDVIKQHENATREANQADEQQDRPSPEIRAILDAPQGIETKKSTNDTQQDNKHHGQILLVPEANDRFFGCPNKYASGNYPCHDKGDYHQ